MDFKEAKEIVDLNGKVYLRFSIFGVDVIMEKKVLLDLAEAIVAACNQAGG